jgi:acyl-CoA synthetase (AMP-forming)/AMP-acid ligase II
MKRVIDDAVNGEPAGGWQDRWIDWSRAGWARHVPEVTDELVNGFGEGTIHGLAHATAKTLAERAAVRMGSEWVTHGGLDAMAARCAGWLQSRVARGDRVLLAAPVSLLWIAMYLGILRAGAVAVLANPSYTKPELDQLAATADPALVIAEVDEAWLAGKPEPWVQRGEPDSPALLAFTSGTTGNPKGVPLTHRQLLTSIRSAMTAWNWSSREVLVHALPLFHQHGLGGLHATLIAGSRLHLLPHFEPAALVETVERSHATVLFAVPTMYQRLAGLEPSSNRLRLCISGSAPLSANGALEAERVLGSKPLVRYGLTESGLDVSQVYGDPHRGTVGLPLPGVLVRLAGDGEIQMRGPQVFGGYLGGEPAFTDDGWFRTGDLGRVDEASGELVIEGRSKELIITGGMKVHPREVEEVLERHDSVAEAAVAGLPSELWGEEVTAWVVLREGASFDAEGLVGHVRASLAAYKVPKQVHRVDTLPRNHAGKLDRTRLASG